MKKPRGGLKYAWTDPDGYSYHTFAQKEFMPVTRIVEMERIAMFMSANMTRESINGLTDVMRKSIEKIIEFYRSDVRQHREQVGTWLSRALMVCDEFDFRRSYLIPSELMIEMAALVLVREDENPDAYDHEMQLLKEATIREAWNNGDAFFLRLPILLGGVISSPTTFTDLIDYFKRSKADSDYMERRMEVFKSAAK